MMKRFAIGIVALIGILSSPAFGAGSWLSKLYPEEQQFCRTYGTLGPVAVEARDRGIPLERVLSVVIESEGYQRMGEFGRYLQTEGVITVYEESRLTHENVQEMFTEYCAYLIEQNR